MFRHRRRRPKGLILMIVLALLTIFTLMGLAFVIMAAQTNRSAQTSRKFEQAGDPPQAILKRALEDVLVGPDDNGAPFRSVIGPHSLLEDLYGDVGFGGTLNAAPNAIGNGQMVLFDSSIAPPPVQQDGYYNGRVLTFLTGPAKGRSTRITGYSFNPLNSQATLRVMSFDGPLPNGPPAAGVPGDRFWINGREFSGFGFGYNPATLAATGLLDAHDYRDPVAGGGWELALTPNPTHPDYYAYMTLGPDLRYGIAGVDDDGNTTIDDASELNAPGSDDGLPIFAHEDFDAPDFQNMILAMQVSDTGLVPLPSLHRPDLCNYWMNRQQDDGNGNLIYPWYDLPAAQNLGHQIRSKVVLRPSADYNDYRDANGNGSYDPAEPWVDLDGDRIYTQANDTFTDMDGDNQWDPSEIDFTGRRFDYVYGPWDVDNDGDGESDSNWADVGLGVRQTATGELVKPLAAIMVLDQDGKLNLNAHGAPLHLTADPQSLGAYAGQYPNPTSSLPLPRGEGYGPAEVNLAAVLYHEPFVDQNGNGKYDAGDTYNDTNGNGQWESELFDLFAGKQIASGALIDGRWGEVYRLLLNGLAPRPGMTANNANNPIDDDRPVAIGAFANGPALDDFAGDQFLFTLFGPYGSPVSIQGNMSLGIDLRGNPFYNGGFGPLEGFNSPYEIDLFHDARRGSLHPSGAGFSSVDRPFTPDEMEPLKRPFDIDVQTMPSRIALLAPILTATPANRRRVTTESWDQPIPSFVPTPEIRTGLSAMQLSGPTTSVIDLVRGKIAALNPPALPPYYNAAELTNLANALNAFLQQSNDPLRDPLSPDLIAGLKIDVNRPFGNNYDDNGNGVVDEPGETGTEPLWANSIVNGVTVTDHNADGLINGDDLYARQRLARHLFVMAMLLTDTNYLMPSPNEFNNPADPNHLLARRELTIRRLAQWAVNVADARDRDGIMTPFEYDMEPFTDNNGDGTPWDVDGIIGQGSGDDGLGTRRFVFGTELPHLLLTEAVAFHDRRVEDTPAGGGLTTDDNNGDTMADDEDLDQRRIPQGSLFVELYNTRNYLSNNGLLSSDLYSPGGIDLGRLAPNDPVNPNVTYPIWRLAISESTIASADNDVRQRTIDTPDSITFQPEEMGGAGQTLPPVDIDRIVWFANQQPIFGQTIDADRIYYRRAGANPVLPPGQYAVVGPHRTYSANPSGVPENQTKIGSSPAGTPPPAAVGLTQVDFSDNNNGISYTYPTYGAAPGANQIKDPLGIPVAGDVVGGLFADGAGISVSEPPLTAYYPFPNDINPTIDPHDSTETIDRYNPPLDEPFDNTRLLGTEGLLFTRTAENYRTVILQRLADPLTAHNPLPGQPGHNPAIAVNPYLSVDWLPVDLTVFNGESLLSSSGFANVRPEDLQAGVVANDIHFATRQRGNPRTPLAPNQNAFNVWAPDSEDPPFIAANQASHYWSYLLDQTLGYLNLPFQQPGGPIGWDDAALQAAGYPVLYAGDPLRPFPWLTWFDRPFVSQMDLLLVPASSSGRLGFDYSASQGATGPNADYPNRRTVGGAQPGWPYGHLLSALDSASSDPAAPNNLAGDYYRILEYTRVPSRYSGTETLLDPEVYRAGSTVLANLAQGAPYYAPFNRVSRYRDPGRVNVNTIFDTAANAVTWQGVMNDFASSADNEFWRRIVLSRQGYAATTGLPFDPNPFLPTIFANPFRSYGSAYLVPIDELRRQSNGTVGRDYVESGLLRSDEAGPPGPDYNRPLLAFDPGVVGPTTVPADFRQDFYGTDRNAAMRYQPLTKLGNTVTTRSNVYAVWITIGYFEVEQVPIDPLRHPDGYRLLQEQGFDSGEIKRHRAFYLIDRSRAVAFERGQDHNVEDTILLERYIE